ncbi:hypothetical protein BJP36_39330 [Moorena producens JHB]|uniref:Uncharacterized protein n=1 Tax=Moorena producens (strain JHB) TaxID=1454205 RepID=A0A9Q9SUW7_MOOP1|nr:hypothetical protein [Moorena producens]WAN70109.1 hypothetical protein BJP36_39330 [Moorena producens JHB]
MANGIALRARQEATGNRQKLTKTGEIVFASILVHCSLFPIPCSQQLPRSLFNLDPKLV